MSFVYICHYFKALFLASGKSFVKEFPVAVIIQFQLEIGVAFALNDVQILVHFPLTIWFSTK